MPWAARYLLVIAIVVVSWAPVFSQSSADPAVDTGAVIPDSASQLTEPIGQPFQMTDDPTQVSEAREAMQRNLQSQTFFSSPTGTLLKSVAFPGWGQWANGKKQKAAFYFGVESYWITKALIWRHRARTADDISEFTHARDRRNYFYWLTGITVFVSMFDAYADRYLLTMERTRDMPDEFWGAREPLPQDNDWRLSLAIKF